MFKIRSIKGKLIFATTFICMISLLLVSVIGYTISYHLVLTNAKDKLSETSQKYANQINYWLSTESTKLHSINEAIKIGNFQDKAYLESYLKTKYRTSDNVVLDYYIGLRDKSFITGSKQQMPTAFDCTTSAWYKQAIAKQGIIYTAPHVDQDSSKVIITIAEPISINGRTVGVIAADITIRQLISLVDNIKIAPNSYAFLLDTDNGFITHIKPQFLPMADKKFYIDKIMNGRFKDIGSQVSAQDISITEARDFDAMDKYFIITNIDETNWSLGLAVPKRELTKNLMLLLEAFICISILSIVAALLSIIFSINYLSKPMNHLKQSGKTLLRTKNKTKSLEQIFYIASLTSAHAEEAATSMKKANSIRFKK